MKQCSKCKQEKPYEDFHKNKNTKDGYDNRCKSCRKKEARESYKKDPFVTLARCKKAECKKKGLKYNLDAEYLKKIWEDTCPVFGTSMTIGNSGYGSHRSGHLDRIDPSKGYIKGNVKYISGRANRIKYDATIDELKAIIRYMETH